CAEALRAVADRAADLRIDPGRIGLGGDSAGGNLAAVLALMARDGALPPVRAQTLIYPALDLTPEARRPDQPADTMFMRPETMDWFVAHHLGPEGDARDWRASPGLAADLAGLPPTQVVTAGHDVLRDQGLGFAARLADAGVTVRLRDFPGQIHNFVAMPHAIPTAHVAIAEIAEFLVEHLCGDTGA
uniref:alpha/beta hydrolase n=1 Tax=Oceaniglobus roseus TaxID=1737570 RepID=UPI001300125E